jgi:hypothetical protein
MVLPAPSAFLSPPVKQLLPVRIRREAQIGAERDAGGGFGPNPAIGSACGHDLLLGGAKSLKPG